MACTQLYLVRHGEQDQASGHTADGGLSQVGREQADRLGRRLRADRPHCDVAAVSQGGPWTMAGAAST